MRTMRSLAVLFFVLAQFATVEAIAENKVPGCGTTYSCYAPEHCTDEAIKFKDSTAVIKIEKTTKIIDTCAFLVRVHGFATNWVHISMESADPTVTLMEFLQKTPAASPVTRTFSCATGGKAKYTQNDKEYGIETSKNLIPDPRIKFHCTFVVKLDSDEHVIAPAEPGLTVQFAITKTTSAVPEETIKIPTALADFLKCDPTTFAYNMSTEVDQKFAELKSEPNHYYCEIPNIFKLKYRLNENKEYEPVTEIKCVIFGDEKDFYVNNNKYADEAPVDIRCAADAKFFCKYPPNAKKNMKEGEGLMEYNGADWLQMTPSSLKCPADKPYLFIGGNFFPDPNIECRNYGGTEYWTVNKQHRLTQTGLETYCSATIDCALKYKIPDGSVEKGTLDTKNLPVCYNEKGVLHVGNEISSNVTCDLTTGDFKYKLGGKEKIVDKNTKFRCEYPVVEDFEKNKQNKNILMGVGIGAIVFCVFFVGGTTAFAGYRMRKHIKQKNEKYKKEAFERFQREELKFNHFAMHEDEIEAIRQAKREAKAEAEGIDVEDVVEEVDAGPQIAEFVDPSKWSELIMDFRFSTKKTMGLKDQKKPESEFAPGFQADVKANLGLRVAATSAIKPLLNHGKEEQKKFSIAWNEAERNKTINRVG